MTEHQEQTARVFVIRSEDRSSTDSISNFWVNIGYDQSRSANVKVALNSCAIPIAWYGINSNNNKVTVYEDRNSTFNSFDFVMPEGNYNITNFLTEMIIALNAQSLASLATDPITYSATISSITGKLTISTSSGTHTFVLKVPLTKQGYRMMGLDKYLDLESGVPSLSEYAQSQVSKNFVDLTFVKSLNLKTGFAGQGFTSAPNSSNTLFASIPLQASAPFELISWINPNPEQTAVKISSEDFQGMEQFLLEGGNGEPLQMYADWSCEIIMYMS